MKIFHLTDHLPDYHRTWGGAEQVAYRYLKLLADSGKVQLIVGAVKPVKPVRENFKFIRIRVTEDLFPEKFHLYITGLKNRVFSFDLIAFFHLLLIFIKERPAIIHLHKTNKISLFSAILAAKILRIKIVLAMYDYWYLCLGGMLMDEEGNLCKRFHGPWCKDCQSIKDFRQILPFTTPLRRPIFDFFFRRIDAFVVLSNAQAKLLTDYGLPQKKIFLVRQVFDFSQKQATSKIRKNMILFAGWLDPRKGLQVAIEAMSRVIKAVTDAQLVVLELQGIKGYQETITKMIKKLDLNKYVKFYGRLTKEEFNHFLIQAQVVVVPEQWENMSPVIVIEAMAKGKAMVASKIGGIPEFINDGINGLLVKRDDPLDFAEKILWLLQNPEKAQKLGEQAAKDIVKLCDKRKILTGLLKLYSNL